MTVRDSCGGAGLTYTVQRRDEILWTSVLAVERPTSVALMRSSSGSGYSASRNSREIRGALINKAKRVGHTFRNFDHYRLRLLLGVGLD